MGVHTDVPEPLLSSQSADVHEGTIQNVEQGTTKVRLPQTGGVSTYGFTIAGVALIASALILILIRKRQR